MTNPTIEGPVSAGQRGRPWSAPTLDFVARGSVMEEFFVDGTAWCYEPDGEGPWTAKRGETQRFVTRFLVVRPADASRFNGTVFVHWLNVTAGYELGNADNDEILSGYAWVGASAQRIGIDGRPPGAAPYSGRQLPQKPLKEWDPERYGSLVHPGDRWSFDIYTQVARCVGPDREKSPDPMGGLPMKRVVAIGASQSGGRLTTYINFVQPLERVFDAFVPTITSGLGTPLGEMRPGAGRASPGIREDSDVPVMQLNTECEAVGMFRVRRPDTDRYRFWEVAGAPHAVALAPAAQPRPEGRIDNKLTYQPVLSAAYRHVHRWLVDGTPPPSQPLIEFESADPPTIRRDARGNAAGGIRLPEMAAPIAEYHGSDELGGGLTRLYGWARPFTREELRSLYASTDGYRDAYRRAVDDLAATAAIRPEDVAPMKADAETTELEL